MITFSVVNLYPQVDVQYHQSDRFPLWPALVAHRACPGQGQTARSHLNAAGATGKIVSQWHET